MSGDFQTSAEQAADRFRQYFHVPWGQPLHIYGATTTQHHNITSERKGMEMDSGVFVCECVCIYACLCGRACEYVCVCMYVCLAPL